MNQYNIHNKWSKLKTVILGNTYYPEFYRDIKNDRIRNALQRIAEESHKDLENYEQVLKDFGCKVLRPKLDPSDSIMNYMNESKLNNIPRAPLQPRDNQLVVDNKLVYQGNKDHPAIKQCLDEYNSTDVIDGETATLLPAKDWYNIVCCEIEWPTYEEFINLWTKDRSKISNHIIKEIKNLAGFQQINFLCGTPSVTVVGKDVYIDTYKEINDSYHNADHLDSVDVAKQFFRKHFPDKRLNFVSIGGHNDSSFHTIKPGAILSLADIQTYNQTFPAWDVCYLPDQSWSKVRPFLDLKKKNQGKWWLPGEEDNDEFTNFAETWLQDWVGYVEETVFDVNVLVLDEHHVCVANPDNQQVNNFLKKHNMEPVYVPWRHRYFWDGGLHCLTLDLERESAEQDYFANRTKPVFCKGFD